MINWKVVSEPVKKLVSVTCDVCKKEYTYKGEEGMEAQEFYSMQVNGGYGSVFGDGEEVFLDICQHCFKKLVVDKLPKE